MSIGKKELLHTPEWVESLEESSDDLEIDDNSSRSSKGSSTGSESKPINTDYMKFVAGEQELSQ